MSDPTVTLRNGKDFITLSIPELRPETVKMIMEDARALCDKLEAIGKKWQAIINEGKDGKDKASA